MRTDFKNIHIGVLINQRVMEYGIEISRICNFLKCTEEEVEKMYASESIDTEKLLRWSKLLEYDFFRLYSQHLVLYAPAGNAGYNKVTNSDSGLPRFRKNLYTKELIEFVMEKIEQKKMTKKEVIDIYGIPKTTLYKWIYKHAETQK